MHFQLFLLAPQRSCEVVAIEGAKEVRALDGVSNCRFYVRPGQTLDGGVATKAVGVVGGVVPERINSPLRLGFACEGEPQPRFVNGAELSSP
ncbi:hypothetical protein ACFWNR_00665 [Streptomyces virginiae]|uniref:hypothetical protein n=1 Tax=Streptomyces virginiae TaxID=1961 RepID=UPI0036566E2A